MSQSIGLPSPAARCNFHADKAPATSVSHVSRISPSTGLMCKYAFTYILCAWRLVGAGQVVFAGEFVLVGEFAFVGQFVSAGYRRIGVI